MSVFEWQKQVQNRLGVGLVTSSYKNLPAMETKEVTPAIVRLLSYTP